MGALISVVVVVLLMRAFLSAACSASGSYPSFSILSASAVAAFSAASKSMSSATIRFAPNLLVFFAPRIFFRAAPVPTAVPGLRAAVAVGLIAVGAGREFSATSVAAARPKSPLNATAAAPFGPPADRKGEAVREITEGVPTLEGGLLGLLIAGLSHEEKKSSSVSVAGVELPSPGVPAISSVMTTSSGYLQTYFSMCA